MLNGGLIVLFGSSEGVGSETYHRFRQENNFYYLSGYDEPSAKLLIAPPLRDHRSPLWEEFSHIPRDILFLPKVNRNEERWTGPKPDPFDPGIAARTGFSSVKTAGQFASELRRLAKAYPVVYTLFPPGASEATPEQANVEKLRMLLPFATIRDVRGSLGALRQVKSDGEVRRIQRAAQCTIDGIRNAAKQIRSGVFEYQIAAVLKYTFEGKGCMGLAFDPIVASGQRSTILHYVKDTARMQSGDVVVVDVGAEYAHYAADITRTFPVSGRFTPRQREIYKIVLGAQKAAIRAIRPGMRITGHGPDSLYQIAYDYINTHGKDSHGESLGRYFIHGLGHHVGLNVHDAGDPGRPLQPGMVITIEPGIYLPEEHFGVRIEDMALVTETGYVLLTKNLPREPGKIEKLMKK